MKNLTDYLTESQRVYSFKIKLAGEVTNEETAKLKTALEKFSVVNLSAGKRTPIQKVPMDFPDLENMNITIFDLDIRYPTIVPVLEEYISRTLQWPIHCVRVRNANDPVEVEQTLGTVEHSNLLNTPELSPSTPEAHKLVGAARTMDLLKELSQANHAGDQYKGVNDAILASNLPEETKQAVMDMILTAKFDSPVGSNQNHIPDPVRGN
jgi:hypothetical protein